MASQLLASLPKTVSTPDRANRKHQRGVLFSDRALPNQLKQNPANGVQVTQFIGLGLLQPPGIGSHSTTSASVNLSPLPTCTLVG
jgi:hypothetical protein